jgi:hypothetical protein
MTTIPVPQQFALNLHHHGGDANSGITYAFLDLCREFGFEVLPRRTTIALRRNGRTVVMDWIQDPQSVGHNIAVFHLHGQRTNPIVDVRYVELLALARQGTRLDCQRAMRDALENIVEQLWLATEVA